VHALLSSVTTRGWEQQPSERPSFEQIVMQLDLAASQAPPLVRGNSSSSSLNPANPPEAANAPDAHDIFISFRFLEALTEARELKQKLEQLNFSVFLSNGAAGDNIQRVISQALQRCRLTIILASHTYGKQTNALFDTSSEMNYIIGQSKPYYLVRMIPPNESWAEPHVTMAFHDGIIYKLWIPGDPIPWDLLHEVGERLRLPPGSVPLPAAAPSPA